VDCLKRLGKHLGAACDRMPFLDNLPSHIQVSSKLQLFI